MRTDFGESLRTARIAAGLGLLGLAERLGVSVPYLSDVERGNRAPLTAERVRQAAEILGAPHLVRAATQARLDAGSLDVSDLPADAREEVCKLVLRLRGAA